MCISFGLRREVCYACNSSCGHLATQDVFLNKIEKIVRKIEKFVVKIDEGWFSIPEMKSELKWSQWLT